MEQLRNDFQTVENNRSFFRVDNNRSTFRGEIINSSRSRRDFARRRSPFRFKLNFILLWLNALKKEIVTEFNRQSSQTSQSSLTLPNIEIKFKIFVQLRRLMSSILLNLRSQIAATVLQRWNDGGVGFRQGCLRCR